MICGCWVGALHQKWKVLPPNSASIFGASDDGRQTASRSPQLRSGQPPGERSPHTRRMELNLGTSIELARRSQAGKASTFASFRCAAFHPSEPYLFLAVEDEIYSTRDFLSLGRNQNWWLAISNRWSASVGFINFPPS